MPARGEAGPDLELGQDLDAGLASTDSSTAGGSLAGAVVVGTASQVLWNVLADA
jgi:hypothetical protein